MAEFAVKDMTCGHCVSTISKALTSALPGATINVNLDERKVRVEGVEDPDDIANIIRNVGYTPEAL